MIIRVYDGAQECGSCDHCPVAEHDTAAGTVTIYGPVKPWNGKMTMSVAEFNALLRGARPVE